MCDKQYCLIDHATGAFVISDNHESLVANSYHSPKINKSLREHSIDYAEWKEAVLEGAMCSSILNQAHIDNGVGFTITVH